MSKKANYEGFTELFSAVHHAGGCKASAYFVPGRTIAPCALMMNRDAEIWVNHLQNTGDSDASIGEEMLGENMFLLKHLPVDYSRAVFWRKQKEVIYVDLLSMEEAYCKIREWEDRGYDCVFKVKFEYEKETRELHASEYGQSWVFLDPET